MKFLVSIFAFSRMAEEDSFHTMAGGQRGDLLISVSPVFRVLMWGADWGAEAVSPLCLMWRRNLNLGFPQCKRLP